MNTSNAIYMENPLRSTISQPASTDTLLLAFNIIQKWQQNINMCVQLINCDNLFIQMSLLMPSLCLSSHSTRLDSTRFDARHIATVDVGGQVESCMHASSNDLRVVFAYTFPYDEKTFSNIFVCSGKQVHFDVHFIYFIDTIVSSSV